MSDSISSLGQKGKGASGTQVTEQRRIVANARAYNGGLAANASQAKIIGAIPPKDIRTFNVRLNVQSEITGMPLSQ